jgi:hypothetical protein
MLYFFIIFFNEVSLTSINGDYCTLCKASLQNPYEEAGNLTYQSLCMTDDLVKLVQKQIEIHSVWTQEFNFYLTDYNYVNRMTLKAIEAEKLSLQLLDLIDITHENSMLLENKADESIEFASTQAKAAELCLKNPCINGKCIVDFLKGSFSCRCYEGSTGKSLFLSIKYYLIINYK